MKPKLFLRISSVLIFIHLLGHGVGHFTWKTQKDPKMQEVVNSMLGYKTEFMGAVKSMGDYFNGFSLMMFFVFGMSICILWFVSGFIDNQKEIAKKILYPISITYIAFGVIEFLCFFPFAASLSFGAGLLTLFSIFCLEKRN